MLCHNSKKKLVAEGPEVVQFNCIIIFLTSLIKVTIQNSNIWPTLLFCTALSWQYTILLISSNLVYNVIKYQYLLHYTYILTLNYCIMMVIALLHCNVM